jgi:hypothetical protein
VDSIHSPGRQDGCQSSCRKDNSQVSPSLVCVLRFLTTNRALQLHPNVPSLYILAASHELHSLSASAARTLLQRGIRLNPNEIRLWTEYVKMELGFIEGLRRRWNILGLDMDVDPNEHLGADEMESLAGDDEEKATETGRWRIMHGAIVKSVMTNAVEGEGACGSYHRGRSLNRLFRSTAQS